jgi:hypothetical protein
VRKEIDFDLCSAHEALRADLQVGIDNATWNLEFLSTQFVPAADARSWIGERCYIATAARKLHVYPAQRPGAAHFNPDAGLDFVEDGSNHQRGSEIGDVGIELIRIGHVGAVVARIDGAVSVSVCLAFVENEVGVAIRAQSRRDVTFVGLGVAVAVVTATDFKIAGIGGAVVVAVVGNSGSDVTLVRLGIDVAIVTAAEIDIARIGSAIAVAVTVGPGGDVASVQDVIRVAVAQPFSVGP